MNEKIFNFETKEITKILGETLDEYKNNLKNLKCPKFKRISSKSKKDNVLESLGLSEKDLKKKKV